MPQKKVVAGVRVGLVGDKFIVNPTTKEMENSELDLVLAGTDDAILMIEVFFFPHLTIFCLQICLHWVAKYGEILVL